MTQQQRNEIQNLENYYIKFSNSNNSAIINKTLEHYVQKSIFHKNLFFNLSIAVIILNASIPLINSIPDLKTNILTSIASTLTVIITSILTILAAKDNWMRYRSYAEELKTECNLFNNNIGEYSCENIELKEQRFILSFERINKSERTLWKSTHENDKVNVPSDET